jgi:transposase-like protein
VLVFSLLKKNMSVQKKRKYDSDFERNAVLLSEEPGNGKEAMAPHEQKIRDLERRFRDAEMERDILTKAMAIVSRTPK